MSLIYIPSLQYVHRSVTNVTEIRQLAFLPIIMLHGSLTCEKNPANQMLLPGCCEFRTISREISDSVIVVHIENV